MRILKNIKIGFWPYMTAYVLLMLITIAVLFTAFPIIGDLFKSLYPTAWVRYTVMFLIIAIFPIVSIAALLYEGAGGMWFIFDFPTKKYTKIDVARIYFLFGIGTMAILLLSIFLIYGTQI